MVPGSGRYANPNRMSTPVCSTCHGGKAGLVCGLCAASTCKTCAQFLEAGSFSFLPEIPPELAHDVYCATCADRVVAPALADYEAAMARARETLVFAKSQGKETRLIRRQEKPVRVEACDDREETVLRLAFLASRLGYNAIVDMDLVSRKVRNHAYQTLVWSGTGVPANVSEKSLVKDRSIWSNPN